MWSKHPHFLYYDCYKFICFVCCYC